VSASQTRRECDDEARYSTRRNEKEEFLSSVIVMLLLDDSIPPTACLSGSRLIVRQAFPFHTVGKDMTSIVTNTIPVLY